MDIVRKWIYCRIVKGRCWDNHFSIIYIYISYFRFPRETTSTIPADSLERNYIWQLAGLIECTRKMHFSLQLGEPIRFRHDLEKTVLVLEVFCLFSNSTNIKQVHPLALGRSRHYACTYYCL